MTYATLITLTVLAVLISSSLPQSLTHSHPSSHNDAFVEDAIDHYWINLAHQHARQSNPQFPFGAAIVDSRNNTLLCLSSNQMRTGNPIWSKWNAHGEMVAMENCTQLYLHDVDGGKNNPDWRHMTLYSTVEPCPMCAQAMIWRGIRRVVFGARADALAHAQCWTQSRLTVQEVVRHSSHWAPFHFVRGPLHDVEADIVSVFPSSCSHRHNI